MFTGFQMSKIISKSLINGNKLMLRRRTLKSKGVSHLNPKLHSWASCDFRLTSFQFSLGYLTFVELHSIVTKDGHRR